MLQEFIPQLEDYLSGLLKKSYSKDISLPPIELQSTSDKIHGDLTTTLALRSAKSFSKSPAVLGSQFIKIFEAEIPGSVFAGHIQKIEFINPGFINFYLTPKALFDIVACVYQEKNNYGRSLLGQGKKVQIEFVSANPTGPLSIAHARQAAVGDALANILNFLGFEAKKEFYVNDEGNQINILGNSGVILVRFPVLFKFSHVEPRLFC